MELTLTLHDAPGIVHAEEALCETSWPLSTPPSNTPGFGQLSRELWTEPVRCLTTFSSTDLPIWSKLNRVDTPVPLR